MSQYPHMGLIQHGVGWHLKMQDKHFHFHDIKAKGVSDMVGEQWAGHQV